MGALRSFVAASVCLVLAACSAGQGITAKGQGSQTASTSGSQAAPGALSAETPQSTSTAAAKMAQVAPSSGGVAGTPVDAKTHYIEFRARAGTMPYGHTYMVYGRVDRTGKPVERHHIGLLPKAGWGGLVVGTAVPMEGTLEPSDADRTLPVLNSYRHLLTTAQYESLQKAIAEARRNPPKWTLFDTNCNWFAAKMAVAAGLKAEAWTKLLPVAFVQAIEDANRATRASKPKA